MALAYKLVVFMNVDVHWLTNHLRLIRKNTTNVMRRIHRKDRQEARTQKKERVEKNRTCTCLMYTDRVWINIKCIFGRHFTTLACFTEFDLLIQDRVERMK